MTSAEISKEISDLNLTYMLLAQKLLRQDRGAAMLRLGISPELADLLLGMSLAQLVKLAATNFLLCSFRLEDQPSLGTVAGDERDPALQQAHISILMACRQVSAMQGAAA